MFYKHLLSTSSPGVLILKLKPVPGVDTESKIKGDALILEILESKGVPTFDLHNDVNKFPS